MFTGLREAFTMCHAEPPKKHQSGQQAVAGSEREVLARDFIGISTEKGKAGQGIITPGCLTHPACLAKAPLNGSQPWQL